MTIQAKLGWSGCPVNTVSRAASKVMPCLLSVDK